MRLKQKVAELTKEDVFEHYKKIEQGIIKFGDDRKSFFEDYNKRITELSEKYEGQINGILNFLYASDCQGKISVNACKDIYHKNRQKTPYEIFDSIGDECRHFLKDFCI